MKQKTLGFIAGGMVGITALFYFGCRNDTKSIEAKVGNPSIVEFIDNNPDKRESIVNYTLGKAVVSDQDFSSETMDNMFKYIQAVIVKNPEMAGEYERKFEYASLLMSNLQVESSQKMIFEEIANIDSEMSDKYPEMIRNLNDSFSEHFKNDDDDEVDLYGSLESSRELANDVAYTTKELVDAKLRYLGNKLNSVSPGLGSELYHNFADIAVRADEGRKKVVDDVQKSDAYKTGKKETDQFIEHFKNRFYIE